LPCGARLSAAAGRRRMLLLFYTNQGQTSSTETNIYKRNTKCGPSGPRKERQYDLWHRVRPVRHFPDGKKPDRPPRTGLCPTGVRPGRAGGPGPGRTGPPHPAAGRQRGGVRGRSEEHTSELQSRFDLVCRLLLEKKKL